MALSPADFYAYSRATGAPVPEDPRERAEMAPEVLEFRRNQLKTPQREEEGGFNLTNLLGIGAAAAGLAGGAYGLTRALRKTPEKVAVAPSPKEYGGPAQRLVRDLGRAEDIPAPSKAPEPTIPPTTPDVTPEATPETQAAQAQRMIRQHGRLVPREKAVARPSFTPRSFLENKGALLPAEDLTSLQTAERPSVVKQQVEATDPGLDQVVNRGVVIPEQRDVNLNDFASFSRDAARVERVDAVVDQIKNFPQETARVASTKSLSNIWELEEQLEEMGRQAQEYYGARYERGGRSVSDLTGELELSPQQARAMRGAKIGTVSTKAGLSAGRALDLSTVSDSATERGRFTPGELLERTMAAASYPREIRDQILNPDVPREQIREFLGSTPKIRGGAVSSNPTMEIAGGARASMTDAPMEELQTAGVGGRGLTYAETADLKQLGQKEKLEQAGFTYDPNTGNYYQEIDDLDIDPTEVMTANREMGTDYGDTEGVGNLLIETESFRERTNKGTTQIPGVIQEARGAAPGSERQLRSADVVVPLRRTAEGVQTTGLDVATADPTKSFGQLLRMQDVGYKGGMGIETADINVGTNKLTGGFETAVNVVPDKITTQPVADWAPPIMYGETIRGTNLRQPYKPTSARIVTGEAPLMGIKRAPLVQDEKVVGWTTLKTAQPQNVSLDRATIQNIAAQAQSDYFNNPSAKAAYLRENNPDALKLGLAQGKTLADIGESYDYQGFIIKTVDDYLMNQEGIDLPVLKPQISKTTGNSYYPTEANAFVMGLLKTEKDTPIYGERINLSPEGKKVVKGFNKGGYPIYETTGTSAPIPGKYQVRGEGGIDPMTIGDDYDGENVAYYAPRIDTASQRKVMQEGQRLGATPESMLGMSSTLTGAQMASLRSEMSTPQAGVGMRKVPVRDPRTGQRVGTERVSTMNIGSFARTQNPYTGPAAPAMGPSSRVLSGNYQYTPEQLEVNLPSTQSTANTQTVEYYEPQASNLDAVMKQLQAQAGRRRGSRKN
jgi:hypothetical protein